MFLGESLELGSMSPVHTGKIRIEGLTLKEFW